MLSFLKESLFNGFWIAGRRFVFYLVQVQGVGRGVAVSGSTAKDGIEVELELQP